MNLGGSHSSLLFTSAQAWVSTSLHDISGLRQPRHATPRHATPRHATPDKTRPDQTRQDKTTQDQTRPDKTGTRPDTPSWSLQVPFTFNAIGRLTRLGNCGARPVRALTRRPLLASGPGDKALVNAFAGRHEDHFVRGGTSSPRGVGTHRDAVDRGTIRYAHAHIRARTACSTQHTTPHSDRTQGHTAQHNIGHSTQHNTHSVRTHARMHAHTAQHPTHSAHHSHHTVHHCKRTAHTQGDTKDNKRNQRCVEIL